MGAGPAGIRAAVEARAAGAEVLVLDEAPRPGGQIYRQLPPEIQPEARDPLGRSRAKSRPLFADLERAGATVRSGAEVWGVLPDRVLLAQPRRSRRGAPGRARSSWPRAPTTGPRRCRAGRCRASSPPEA